MKYRIDDTVKIIKVNESLNSKRFIYPVVNETMKISDFDPNDDYLPYCCVYKDDDEGVWVSEEEIELAVESDMASITFLDLSTADIAFLIAIHKEQKYFRNNQLDKSPTHYTTMVKSNTKNKHGLDISNDNIFNVVNGILADRYCNNY